MHTTPRDSDESANLDYLYGQGLHSVLYMLVLALQPLPTFTRSSRRYKHLTCRPRSMSVALCPPSSGPFLQLPAQAQLILVNTAEQLLRTRLTFLQNA